MAVSMARSASLTGFIGLVKSLGGNPESILRQVGLPPDILNDEDNFIPSVTLNRVLELSAQVLSCEDFGLQLSLRQGPAILGPVALALQQATTFQDALIDLQKYLHLHSQAGSLYMQGQDEHFYIQYHPHIEGDTSTKQLVDLTLGVGMKLVRATASPNWKPVAVYFCHEKPSDLKRYQSVFKSPLSFNQEFNGFVIRTADLSLNNLTTMPSLRKHLDQYLNQLEQQHPSRYVDQVAVLIRQLLPTGHCNLQSVATVLNQNPRTLQRNLRAEQSNFQSVLDQVRQDLAGRYLKESSMDITTLSDLLGYGDISVFSRAFKKWYGVPPSQFAKD